MRTLYSILALVILAITGIWAFCSVCLLQKPTHKVVSHREVVFVDIAELAKLHPSAKTMSDMQSMMSLAGSNYIDHRLDCLPPSITESQTALLRPTGLSRAQLENEVAQGAFSALSRLESDQIQAMDVRLQANKENMTESANAEMALQAREIQKEKDDKLRELTQQYASERLNTQMKIAALGIAANQMRTRQDLFGSEKLEVPGDAKLLRIAPESSNSEIASTEAELHGIQAQLGRIMDVSETQTSALETDAQNKINAVNSDFASKINSGLSRLEAGEKKKIQEGITLARVDILNEISALNKGFSSGKSASPARRPHSAIVSITKVSLPQDRVVAQGGGLFKQVMAKLNAQIRSDIRCAVRKIASEKGVDVTFVRTSSRMPDETKSFADIICKRSCGASGLILCPKRG